jgi:hypothetical protein
VPGLAAAGQRGGARGAHEQREYQQRDRHGPVSIAPVADDIGVRAGLRARAVNLPLTA